jgi:glucose uptake protein GlcU
MNKTKKSVGVLSIILGILVIISYSMAGSYSIAEIGIALGYSLYSKLVGILMIVAGIILYSTRNNNSKTSAVVSGIVLVVAVFITFNEFDPTSHTPFLIIKIVNFVQAIRLFLTKPNTEELE